MNPAAAFMNPAAASMNPAEAFKNSTAAAFKNSAVAAFKTPAEAFKNSAAAFMKSSKFPNKKSEAQKNMMMSMLSEPMKAKLYVRKGLSFEKTEKYTEAIDAFKKALEFEPDNKEVQDGHSRCLETFKGSCN